MKIIAEISGNHKHSFEHASKLIDAAHQGGFTHIKFQTLIPDEITVPLKQKEFRITDPASLWYGRYLIDLYEETAMSFSLQQSLVSHCAEIGVTWFSSPFSVACVEFLEQLQCPLYKVASFEATDIDLLDAISQTGKPIIMSTGGLSEPEIERSLSYLRSRTDAEVELLYCVSSYPAQPEEFDTLIIDRWSRKFGLNVGLSDHSEGSYIAPIYVALGAGTIEKHVKLEGDNESIDSEFSLSSEHFAHFINTIRQAEKLSSTSRKVIQPQTGKQYHRSYYYRCELDAGTVVEREHIISLRPNSGVTTFEGAELIGRKLTKKVGKYMPLCPDDFNEIG